MNHFNVKSRNVMYSMVCSVMNHMSACARGVVCSAAAASDRFGVGMSVSQ